MKTISQLIFNSGLLILTLASLTACETVIVQGGGGGVYVDPYRRAWYDVYGNQCTSYGYPMAGCNFYADGSKITSNQDPYSSSRTLYFDYWTYTDSYGFRRDFTGYAWLSSTGILYDSYGNALNEMEDASQSADIITAAAEQEDASSRAAGRTLCQKYALAESAGVSIAKTLQDWAVLGRDRARTQADVEDFSKRLYGVDLSRATRAVKEAAGGNRQALTEVNIDVAAHWGTNPETSKQILSEWYRDELSRLGAK